MAGQSPQPAYYMHFYVELINEMAIVLTWFWTPSISVCVCSQADDDPIMGFHQSFLLKNINDAWVCTNDMFRLAIHNFG